MVLDLFNNEMRAFACRQDVLAKVYRVDRFPDLNRRLRGFCRFQIRVAMEVRLRALEYRSLKRQKAIHIPLPDVFLFRVDEDRKIKEV